jgi:hypothetical protein
MTAAAADDDDAAVIAREGPALSRAVIAEMYRNPFWQARFGDRGRRHADDDGDFHVRYLVEAMRADSPAVMVNYGRWLRSVLVPRGMCTRHLGDNFARLRAAIAAAKLRGGESAVAMLAAAEAGLAYDAPGPRALQDRAARLAAVAVEAMRDRYPYRHPEGGADGWASCLDDALYHLSYLADAVAADDVRLFTDYVHFVARFLAARGLAAAHLDELLGALGAAMTGDSALAAAAAMLSAGRLALQVST